MHLNDFQKDLHDWVDDPIKSWVHSLPFERFDVVSLFLSDHYVPLKYHRDYNFFPYEKGDVRETPKTLQDIIWFRFDKNRAFNFYELDDAGNVIKEYNVEGYSSTFNHFNWHGNVSSHDTATVTIKIEGKFTDEFRKQIYG